MPDKNNEEKIGTIKVPGGKLVDVSYIGGSSFRLLLQDKNGKTNKFVLSLDNVEKLIKGNKLRLTAPQRYEEIKNSILPDGSTKDDKADGTPKSVMERTVEKLSSEGIVGVNDFGEYEIKNQAKKNSSNRVSSGNRNETKNNGTASDNRNAESLKRDRSSKQNDNGNIGHLAKAKDNDEDDLIDGFEKLVNETQPSPSNTRAHNVKQRSADADDVFADTGYNEDNVQNESGYDENGDLIGDINGDGVVDEFDDLVEEEQHRNLLLMILLFTVIVMSIVAFFVLQAITATLLRGEPLDIVPDNMEQQVQSSIENRNLPTANNENPHGNNGQDSTNNDNSANDNNVSNNDQPSKREDFDPEDAVVTYDTATDEQAKTAVAMFQTIRKDIINGDVNAFTQAVDLDTIGEQLSNAYSNRIAEDKNLIDSEKNELKEYYKEKFSENERQHVSDKDPYGSIFGGRIREVRTDPTAQNVLYVVMESISGDHQRACFKMTGDGANGWSVNGIEDADGYIGMILEGRQ